MDLKCLIVAKETPSIFLCKDKSFITNEKHIQNPFIYPKNQGTEEVLLEKRCIMLRGKEKRGLSLMFWQIDALLNEDELFQTFCAFIVAYYS